MTQSDHNKKNKYPYTTAEGITLHCDYCFLINGENIIGILPVNSTIMLMAFMVVGMQKRSQNGRLKILSPSQGK